MKIFLENWITPYQLLSHVLKDHGTQFVRKFFTSFCFSLRVKKHTPAAYHPHTNGHVDCYNGTIVASLLHYVAEPQRDWDIHVQPLTYAYVIQMHRENGTSQLNTILPRERPLTLTIGGLYGTASDIPREAQWRRKNQAVLEHVDLMKAAAGTRIEATQ